MPDPAPSPRAGLAAATGTLAGALGLDPELVERLRPWVALLEPSSGPTAAAAPGAPPDDAVDPGSLGSLHESSLDVGHRRRHGVHYTPADVAELLAGRALGADDPRRVVGASPSVCDPSCGGGAVLLAVVEHLRAAGLGPAEAVGAACGLDLDPLAVDVSRAGLVLWAARAGVDGDELVDLARRVAQQVVVGDALVDRWPAEGELAVVVGNPPFAGQLSRATARDPATVEVARRLVGASVGYADTAGLFLLRGVAAAAPGGRVALLQPLSFLGARDAGAVRRRLLEQAALEEVWLPGRRVFGASVDVCAPVLRRVVELVVPPSDPASTVSVRIGGQAHEVGRVRRSRLDEVGSWSPVAALADGVPRPELTGAPLGERAHATAGFRDEFYALAPDVVDGRTVATGTPAPGGPPLLPADHVRLVTTGLIDPGAVAWGERSARVAGRRLDAPAVDLAALRARAEAPGADRRLGAWVQARLRPKVVVATQTAVVEAAVDADGTWWPAVPVISVVPAGEGASIEELWSLAAALTAPPVSAWLAERSAGTALSARALRVTARLVARVPSPVDADAWAEGADLLRRVPACAVGERGDALLAAGRVLTAAHGLTGPGAAEVLRWWSARAGCPVDA